MADDSALADGSVLVSVSNWGTGVHSRGIEPTDFVTIVVFLEEEAFTSVVHLIALFALLFAVSNGLFVVVGLTIYRVGIADVIFTIVSQ